MGEGRRVKKREGDGKGEERREQEGRMSCQQLHTIHTGSPGVCMHHHNYTVPTMDFTPGSVDLHTLYVL